MKIAIAQLNCHVGDLSGNAHQIRTAMQRASGEGADLLLTPELSLCGYIPEDLLLREDFQAACDQALADLARHSGPCATVVGHPLRRDGLLYNCASVLRNGQIEATYRKQVLPNYNVFDEQRYFRPGHVPLLVEAGGRRVGILVCADIWEAGPADAAQAAGAQLLVVINASPCHLGKEDEREGVVRDRVLETGVPVVYANLVGGQDELVFDGASFALDAKGQVCARLPAFTPDFALLTVTANGIQGPLHDYPSQTEAARQALVLGVRDYIGKNGFPGAIIGLSGGIDSAVTLAVAVEAIGATNVTGVLMPSIYSAAISRDDALAVAANLGVETIEMPIWPIYESFIATLAPHLGDRPADTTHENLQARIRGSLLMALSNRHGRLVLTTSNKTETAVGYATLYGDMAGGFAVLKDVKKLLVYDIARLYNRSGEIIPARTITRPPSAELRPDQSDADSLPPYDVLDAIIHAYVEEDRSPAQIIAAGFDPQAVAQVIRLVNSSEYKRRQAAIGVRLTPRGFGRDRRYPITNAWRAHAGKND